MVHIHNRGEKPLKVILLAYLILALTESSAISTGQALCFEHSNNDSISSSVYFFSIDHTIDWLAENELTIRKARGYSNSLPLNSLLNVFTLAGTIALALYLPGANPEIIKDDNIPIIKNLILLKLRA